MAIVSSTSTEAGDIIIIQVDIPIIGLIALSSFIDETTGEDVNNFFKKEFRFSVDGANFTEWTELTPENLDNTQIDSQGGITFEYRYTHIATGGNADISYQNSLLTGLIVDTGIGEVYSNSVFNQFFIPSDIEVLNWSVNLTEKLYLRGIVPEYITRNQESANEDIDYLAFWRSVALFFAYFTKFIKTITDFSSDQVLLNDFLKDNGIFLCNDHGLQELIYIMQRQYDQFRRRGTLKIIEKKNDTTILVDGELFRLICYSVLDEFIFNLHPPQYSGWVVNNNSPLYKGIGYMPNVNKNYENEEDIVDLDNYPIVDPDEYVSIIEEDDHNVLQILDVDGSDQAGIYANFNSSIIVDSNVTYEISFLVKQPSLANNFTFSVEGYDNLGNIINFLNIEDGVPRNTFFTQHKFLKNDIWYKVTGIIYSKNTNNTGLTNSILNIGVGRKLKFQDGITRLAIRIFGDTDGGSGNNELLIYNIRVQPASFPFGNSFVQLPNLITCWLRNRNNIYSNEQITAIIRKYLVPYNSVFIPVFLDEVSGEGGFIQEDIILLNQDGEPLLHQDGEVIILEYATPSGSLPNPPTGIGAYPAGYPFSYG